MKELDAELRQDLSELIVQAGHSLPPGLLTGGMGVTVTLAMVADKFHLPTVENLAEKMLSDIISTALKCQTHALANGLAGIVYGLQYLMLSGVLTQPKDDYFNSLDSALEGYNILRTRDHTLLSGSAGIWEAVKARIAGNLSVGLEIPFSKGYIRDWDNYFFSNPPIETSDNGTTFRKLIHTGSITHSIDIKRFINSPRRNPGNVSLYDGMAGYIFLKYL